MVSVATVVRARSNGLIIGQGPQALSVPDAVVHQATLNGPVPLGGNKFTSDHLFLAFYLVAKPAGNLLTSSEASSRVNYRNGHGCFRTRSCRHERTWMAAYVLSAEGCRWNDATLAGETLVVASLVVDRRQQGAGRGSRSSSMKAGPPPL